MKYNCEDFRTLISGFLDGELNNEDIQLLQTHLATCDACQTELHQMKQLVTATAALRPELPPDEVWDSFLDGIYNRVERKTGWTIFIIGAIALALFAVYCFIVEPWGPALVKILVAAPIVGLVIVFISILRERVIAAKTDRYSREVQR